MMDSPEARSQAHTNGTREDSAGSAQQPPNPGIFLNLGMAFMRSKVVLTAVELGLFTDLAQHGRSTEKQLRARLGLRGRGLRDFLDCLVSLQALDREDRPEQGESVYFNTPSGDLFMDRNKPDTYVGGVLEMCGTSLWSVWGNLTPALLDDKPAQGNLHGKDVDIFKDVYSDPVKLKKFLGAMTGLSTGSALTLANSIQWGNYRTFVDVGCAQGCIPVVIARAHPHLQGYGYDLPAVKPVFNEYVDSLGLQDRVSFIGGDFFRDDLPAADVLIMGHILHDWGLEDKKMLLSKAHKALPEGGILIVYDAMIDDERRKNTSALIMSLDMFLETPHGFDYTVADCQGWLRDAGFAVAQVGEMPGDHTFIVAQK